jgi:hypothetical protein
MGRKSKPPVVLEIPLDIDGDTVAMIFDAETGQHYDDAGNLESAINYIHQGAEYVVIGVGPELWRDGDVRLTEREVQEAIEHEYALVSDCFGWRVPVLAP